MRTIVDLPELQIAALSVLEAKRNTSRAQLVREAIEQYLKKEMLSDIAGFGAWQRALSSFPNKNNGSATIDGLTMQQTLRAEWER